VASELVTLPVAPAEDVLTRLLAGETLATLTTHRGRDAAGRKRVQITVSHPDPEVVAGARQALLRRCQAERVRAFVV
jgi:hypothetical protein